MLFPQFLGLAHLEAHSSRSRVPEVLRNNRIKKSETVEFVVIPDPDNFRSTISAYRIETVA